MFFSFYLISSMININTIYILNKLSYILYKKKKEESKRRKKKLRLSRAWLLGLIYDPFFPLFSL